MPLDDAYSMGRKTRDIDDRIDEPITTSLGSMRRSPQETDPTVGEQNAK